MLLPSVAPPRASSLFARRLPLNDALALFAVRLVFALAGVVPFEMAAPSRPRFACHDVLVQLLFLFHAARPFL